MASLKPVRYWAKKAKATAMQAAALVWADVHQMLRTTACLISPDNLASIRLAEKARFQYWQDGAYSGRVVQLYKRSR